ncbi:diguanylate cyclase [Roseivivax isoporae]|uniref:diguanylate cyclase n=1 Tax=Roseivivax isoporae LMG 25204 TaxID=1449351 RepID=X7F6L3_9RHOB|nr:diguanylate cyclase [Roseivivax isoporae]ETX28378.1 diguanylate cyclase [Roseivivax isoporae LMG 25204]
MPGRILIADDIATQRIGLRVKLASACYDVLQATSGTEALDVVRRHRPDLVIAADSLPDMSGVQLCASLRALGGDAPPCVLVQPADMPEARVAALSAGAEDVLVRPLDEPVLLARMRSLLRARDSERELRLREDTCRAFGMAEAGAAFDRPARIALLGDRGAADIERLAADLRRDVRGAEIVLAKREELLRSAPGRWEVCVILAGPRPRGSLDLLSDLRASAATRRAAILYVAASGNGPQAATALDLGADDILVGSPPAMELAIRIRKQVTRKKVADRLRDTVREGLRAALTDPLTGLYNRRYALPHLDRVAEAARAARQCCSVLMADIDAFKAINDRYGHAVGDRVIAAVALRLSQNLRASDLVSRYGGEEFLITLPDADLAQAQVTAARLCAQVRTHPVPVGPDVAAVPVTISIGVAAGPGTGPEPGRRMIELADAALYAAKTGGRDRYFAAAVVALDPVPGAAADRAPREPAAAQRRSARRAISRESRSA